MPLTFVSWNCRVSIRELVDGFLVKILWYNLNFMFNWIPFVGASEIIALARVKVFVEFHWHYFYHDFNETIHPEDRQSEVVYSPSMLALCNFVNNSKLMDFPLQGRLFTWKNSFSKSHIDCCLIFTAAGTIWPYMSLTALPGNHSDHIPLCFRSTNIFDWRTKPFCLVDVWWDHAYFAKFVADSWVTVCAKRINLTLRLKEFRHFIKIWDQIFFVTKIRGSWSFQLRKDGDQKLKFDLWQAEKGQRAESIWVQKLRLNWSNAGDQNTKFFHCVASKHYSNNHIYSIQVDESVFVEPENFRCSEAEGLSVPFSEVEIFKALSSCGKRKAPGPDGFNFYFYRRAWAFKKDVFFSSFAEFHGSNSRPSSISTSFMDLVPKVAKSTNIKHYRPISLVNGRGILECSMIGNELVHLGSRRKDKLLVLKLDFCKASDNIDWNYLSCVMRCMNFPAKWIDWIVNCLLSATTVVLFNGIPVEPINLRRGVHQGDPISPYLFLNAVEGLKHIQTDKVKWDSPVVIALRMIKILSRGFNLRMIRYFIFVLILSSCRNLPGSFTVMKLSLYWGPLTGQKLVIGAWDHVIKRFKSRLALWKGSLLSPTGRESRALWSVLRPKE
ncbi:uncharacterized protein LOC126687569 [Mercurialis annua]|uniref:uncharacterized protein LOC126687569 n=1 Tax=Mercurialis annua TaxID=3986 RepID=UPI00215E6EA5|nr:uncharacterized protein LOC126687569 [Mercurialis annua]